MTSASTAVAFVTGGSGYLGRNLLRRLRAEGVTARALVRSPKAKDAVVALGAVPVDGDLAGGDRVVEGMRGCEVVFHCAASVDDQAALADAWRDNVEGTTAMLACAEAAGVRCFVHTGTEAVLVGDERPIVRADERWDYPRRPIGAYAVTKGEAERRVVAFHGKGGMRTVVLRPRFIWGNDDTVLLPKILASHAKGAFAWIGGGANLTSTCHVDNVVEGLLCGWQRGAGGQRYFLTDGPPHTMREVLEAMMRARGVTPTTRTLPRGLAHTLARAAEVLPRGMRPLSHMGFHLIADEVTVVDDRARAELGYAPRVSFEQGVQSLTAVTG